MFGYLKNEKQRGIFGFIGSTVVANALNVLLTKYTKLTVPQSTFISIYTVGNIILYSFDILFAKQKFMMDKTYEIVPYTDLKTRFMWLSQSFYQKYFFRFLITVILDTIIGLSLLNFTIYKLDQYQLFTNWRYRNLIVAAVVSAFTYFLYLSTLRFDWAYEYKENPLLNILVMIWLSLAILITVDEKVIQSNPSEKDQLLKIFKYQ